MGFLNINLVYKKNRTTKQYEIRLATREELKQNYLATKPSYLTGISKEDKPKKVIGLDDLVIYPPNYKDNTVFLQGDKICIALNFKTSKGKMFIKGMAGYTGSYINQDVVHLCGIDYDIPNEITQEVLKQLPSKDMLLDSGLGVHVQY